MKTKIWIIIGVLVLLIWQLNRSSGPLSHFDCSTDPLWTMEPEKLKMVCVTTPCLEEYSLNCEDGWRLNQNTKLCERCMPCPVDYNLQGDICKFAGMMGR